MVATMIEDPDDEPTALISPRKDARFCARVMALGGMPRAVARNGATHWIGPDGRPWHENKKATKAR